MKIVTPLTKEQIDAIIDQSARIKVEIEASLDNLFVSLEAFNDWAEEQIIAKGVRYNLSDIGYSVVGHRYEESDDYLNGVVIIQVNAEVTEY